MQSSLDTPIQYVPRVGPVMAGKLGKLGISSVQDLLYHVPFRYNDFSLISPVARVQPGETVTISGTVESIRAFVTKTHKRIQEAVVSDESGRIHVVWFNQPYLLKIIKPADRIHLSGEVGWFGNKIVLTSPEYEVSSTDGNTSLHTGRIVPIYPETAGVSSKWLRARIAFLLSEILPELEDFLPPSTLRSHNLLDLATAIRHVHFPPDTEAIAPARRRIAFDEVFFLQIRAYEQKRAWEREQRARAFVVKKEDTAAFIRSLPFSLTDDQAHSLKEISVDLGRSVPMNRLLVGDVGSGKTVVAAAAMYLGRKSGFRSLLMAPTQILAEQHYRTLQQILAPLGVSVGLMTGTKNLNSETSDALVGTHALLSKKRSFPGLGLVVIDEQQRFGVRQRSELLAREEGGTTPHFLTMTATPIPRTMAKTVLGAIDVSILNEMPLGRRAVKTWVVPSHKREGAYAWMEKNMRDSGGQAFVICPLIEESETLADVRAVTEEVKTIRRVFPGRGVGLLHGRLKASEKTAVLETFRKKKYDLLVATPVVEVGIDISNATIMLIEDAERFGLANLHQLRGRVGRGEKQSYCLLFTQKEDEQTISRLKSLETVFSGPRLADIDLALRGPGEVFGTKQHGLPKLRIASFTDMHTVNETQEALSEIVAKDPEFTAFPRLQEYAKKSTIREIAKD